MLSAAFCTWDDVGLLIISDGDRNERTAAMAVWRNIMVTYNISKPIIWGIVSTRNIVMKIHNSQIIIEYISQGDSRCGRPAIDILLAIGE